MAGERTARAGPSTYPGRLAVPIAQLPKKAGTWVAHSRPAGLDAALLAFGLHPWGLLC